MKMVLTPGEQIGIRFRTPEGVVSGTFEIHFNTEQHPNSIVLKEVIGYSGSVIGNGGTTLYEDVYNEPIIIPPEDDYEPEGPGVILGEEPVQPEPQPPVTETPPAEGETPAEPVTETPQPPVEEPTETPPAETPVDTPVEGGETPTEEPQADAPVPPAEGTEPVNPLPISEEQPQGDTGAEEGETETETDDNDDDEPVPGSVTDGGTEPVPAPAPAPAPETPADQPQDDEAVEEDEMEPGAETEPQPADPSDDEYEKARGINRDNY